MKRLISVVSIIIMLSSFAYAYNFSGKVVNKKGDAVENAIIKILDSDQVVYSNNLGEFHFENLTSQKIEIKIIRIGYKNHIQAYNIQNSQFQKIILEKKPHQIEDLLVSLTRAKDRETPVVYTNIDNQTIVENNYGQDVPMLVNNIPNVYSYSEAGNGFGYSHLLVRGFSQKRIGVMINGIPLNDPEDHNVYWVNMPDFAESTNDIQLQRGVGSSIYGISTFGGSLNIETNFLNKQENSELYSSFGSYNTLKYGINTTQNIGKNSTINFRISQIRSDNYRDNSSTDLWSYFTNISHLGKNSVTELNIYGGNELTHASWYASSENELQENHQHNPVTYANEIDDFSQPHIELHNSYLIDDNKDLKNTIFYIYGNGFYEQFKYDRDLWEYGVTDSADAFEADLIRKKNVTKNHLGWITQFNLRQKRSALTLGSYLSTFNSDHWGEIKEIIDAGNLPIEYHSGQDYYNYKGEKQYITFFANEHYKINSKFNLMANLYFQHINYKFDQSEEGNFTGEYLNSYELDYNFINPRFGMNYNISDAVNIYGNFSIAQREPTDDELYDIWDGPDDLGIAPLFAVSDTVFTDNGDIKRINWTEPFVKEEKLTDYEFGLGYSAGLWELDLNGYWMNFTDEIVAYGGVDDEGSPIRGNADKTVHRGVEFSAKVQLPTNFEMKGNFSYSDNYFEKFIKKDWTGDDDLSGNTIAGFPSILSNLNLRYKYNPITANMQLQYVGKQYLDNTQNEDRIIDPYKVLNVSIIYTLKELSNKLALTFKINNILDHEYETAGYYDSWSEKNFYWPAAGRNFITSLRITF